MPKETAASEDVDPELLIGEVRECPEIWDVSHEDHRDKAKKRNVWYGLCRKFAADFDEKSEAEKNEYCNKLMNKWRNVKDNYYRYIKKRTQLGTKAGRSYLYAKYLSFLPATNHWTPSNPDVTDTYSESSDSLHLEPASHASDPASPTTRSSKRRRASSPVHVASTTSSAMSSIPAMDEDRLFFESLIPTVRTLDIDQKLEFRTEVMQLLKKVRMMDFQQAGQYEYPDCGSELLYRGRSRRTPAKRGRTGEATYDPPAVTYLLQDLHPDCVQKYEDGDESTELEHT